MKRRNPPLTFIKTGPTRRYPLDAEFFLIMRAAQSQTDDCIHWPFVMMKRYPQISQGGKWGYTLVHRLVCQLVHGDPPPDRPHCAHGCGKSSCINPRHLRWATPAENAADKILHGTSRNPKQRLTQLQVDEIRLFPETVTHGKIAVLYGVHPQTISKVRRGVSWPDPAAFAVFRPTGRPRFEGIDRQPNGQPSRKKSLLQGVAP